MKKVIVFDLDDTLSKEIDYLESAYKEIANYAVQKCVECAGPVDELAVKAYDAMLVAHHKGENVFEALNAYLGLSTPVKVYLNVYRNHKPTLRLKDDARACLDQLKAKGCVIGIISDGRSVQQRHKTEALGLDAWVQVEDYVISEEFGSEKPSLANYEYFMKRYPDAEGFVYVGDNLKKDFIAPNALGWETICLKDDGRNIHKQDFEAASGDALPKRVISLLSEMV